jgi:hypothetical protein
MFKPSAFALLCVLALALAVGAEKVACFLPAASAPHKRLLMPPAQVLIPYERVATRPPNNPFCQAKFAFCPNQTGAPARLQLPQRL